MENVIKMKYKVHKPQLGWFEASLLLRVGHLCVHAHLKSISLY